MRPPDGVQIHAPEFPPKMDWLNVAFLRMAGMLDRHGVMIEFFDTARINSHRTLPYLQGWQARYAGHGLRVIGIHTPAYSFGRDRDTVERAAGAMGIDHPVLLDPDYRVWRLYGNRGWPGRYLFDRRGLLRYIHYGEGDYAEAERAIVEVLAELDDADLDGPPEPLMALRPEDEEGALLEAQTADVSLPGQRERLELRGDWIDGEDYIEAASAGARATVRWSGGGAWSVLSGSAEPGLRETEGTVRADTPGLRLHGFQFTPAPPAHAPLERGGSPWGA
ncbi:MAG: redoxin domain-containing protein [Thermoleophilaceae bacterium]